MLELHPEFLIKNGKKEFVILTYEEFIEIQTMLEDLEDLQDLRQAKNEQINEPSFSLEEVKVMLSIEHLC
jgi:PHD/YefM family antitoxin component YafN of YafNO toxin-antitoxin module